MTTVPSLDVLGLTISEPLAKLRRKFGFDDVFVPFALFDGYRTPAERNGDADTLELEDLLITVAMNSGIGAAAAWSFWAGIQRQRDWFTESNELLARLPTTLDIGDATDEQLATVKSLFDALSSVNGMKVAVAGKVLCRKRPRSVPMLDSFVLPLACHLALEDKQVREFETLPWAQWHNVDRAVHFFRRVCRERRDELAGLCQAFRLLPGEPELAPLRALESLLWWEATQETDFTDPRMIRFQQIMSWKQGRDEDV